MTCSALINQSRKPSKSKKKDEKAKDKGKEEERSEDSNEDAGKGKDGFWAKKKRGVASSGLGKALIEQNLDKESKMLIKALIEMISVTHDKKTAEGVRKDIFKVAAKTLLLYQVCSVFTLSVLFHKDSRRPYHSGLISNCFQDGKLTNEQFKSLRGNFRRICSAVRNGYLVTKSLTPDTADRIATVIANFGNGVKALVKPYLSSSTLERINFLLSIFGSSKFLLSASKEASFDSVAMVLAYYLQETN